MRERARRLFSVADQDTPVADVASDTLLDDPVQYGDRRIVRFVRPNGDAATVMTWIRPGDLDVQIEITPPAQTVVQVRYPDGSAHTVTTDTRGSATLRSLSPGLMTFYIAGSEGDEAWRTAWLRY